MKKANDKRLKVEGNHSRKYLTADELGQLLETVREPRWERLESVIMLALYAGLRQQEIAWLTWEDIDLAGGWLHVRPKKGWSPKSITSERSIPIADELADYLTSSDVVALTEIDTRALTRHIRSRGAMKGTLSSVDLNVESLVRKAREAPGLDELDLVARVTCDSPYSWGIARDEQWYCVARPIPRPLCRIDLSLWRPAYSWSNKRGRGGNSSARSC